MNKRTQFVLIFDRDEINRDQLVTELRRWFPDPLSYTFALDYDNSQTGLLIITLSPKGETDDVEMETKLWGWRGNSGSPLKHVKVLRPTPSQRDKAVKALQAALHVSSPDITQAAIDAIIEAVREDREIGKPRA